MESAIKLFFNSPTLRLLRDEADVLAHVRYCWLHPVKHGLVGRAVEWPHSSIHRDIARGHVEPEWSGVVPTGNLGE